MNSDFITNIYSWHWGKVRNPLLIHSLREADILTADGMPLVWLSWILGCPLPERITGADMIPNLFELSTENKMKVFLLGSETKIAHQASTNIKKKYPNLEIVGIYSPEISISGKNEKSDQEILAKIHQASPDLLLIALGNPKQEIWFNRVKDKLDVPLSIGIGGALDFFSGKAKRAPKGMQKAGLEWFHRLIHDPKRLFKRYFINAIKLIYLSIPLIIYHSYRRLVGYFRKDTLKKMNTQIVSDQDNKNILLVSLPSFCSKFHLNHIEVDTIIIDFCHVHFINLYGLGSLLNLIKNAEINKKTIIIINLNNSIKRLFRVHFLWDLVKIHSYDSLANALQKDKVD